MDWALHITDPGRLLMCQAETDDEARQMALTAYPDCSVVSCVLSAVKCKRAEVHVPTFDEYGENQELHDPPQEMT